MKPASKIPSKIAKHFVSTLKQFLKDAGILPRQLSEMTGTPTRTIYTWLSGKALPPPERISAVKAALRAEAEAARSLADAITEAFGV